VGGVQNTADFKQTRKEREQCNGWNINIDWRLSMASQSLIYNDGTQEKSIIYPM